MAEAGVTCGPARSTPKQCLTVPWPAWLRMSAGTVTEMDDQTQYDRSLRLLIELSRELGRLKIGFALRDAVPVVVIPVGDRIDGFRVRVDDTCTYYTWGGGDHLHSASDPVGAASSIMDFALDQDAGR